MDDIKKRFQNWLEDNKKIQLKTTDGRPSTIYGYTQRLDRLIKRLYNVEEQQKPHWEELIPDISAIVLILGKPSCWINMDEKFICIVGLFLLQQKSKNRQINKKCTQYIKETDKNYLLAYSRGITNEKEPAVNDFLAWVKDIFVSGKANTYLKWLWISDSEKRQLTIASKLFLEFLYEIAQKKGIEGEQLETFETVKLTFACLLDWKKSRENYSSIRIVEATGVTARNFYTPRQNGKSKKELSLPMSAQALGNDYTTLQRLIKNKKLTVRNITVQSSQDEKKKITKRVIQVTDLRRFLQRRHKKRTDGTSFETETIANPKNWVFMSEAKNITGYSEAQIRRFRKEGKIAVVKYKLIRFLYFKPDLERLKKI